MSTPSTEKAVQDILDSTLDRDEKLDALRRLERDIQARAVAAEEGMGAKTGLSDAGTVRAARRKLRDPRQESPEPPTKNSC